MRLPSALLQRTTAFGIAAAVLGMPIPALADTQSLDALIRTALRDHPALASASESAAALTARAGGARSPYWPQVGLNTGTSETTQVSNAQNTAAPFNLSTVGVSVRQQVFNFGKTADDVAAADAAARSGHFQSEARQVDIAYGVRKAGLDWLRARGLQEQTETKQAAANALLQQATAFFQAGRRPKLDVTRAEAGLLQAKADAISARNAVQVALLGLGAAIGHPGAIEAEPVFPPVPALAGLPLAELRARAAGNPIIRESAERLAQAEAAHRRADKANWPDISADLSYGLRARDLEPSQNWGAGISMNVPVFNGFADWRDRDATAAQQRASAADLRAQQLQVDLGIDQATMAIEGARERLTALSAAVRSAEANLAQAQGSYRAGVSAVIDVSDAQSLLSSARADQIRAEADYHLAIADLMRAIGTTGVE